MTAAALGFDRPTANSLDAVSDRDFALEFLAAAAISAMHLSRFAEEIVIWCSAPFRFVRLSDAFTTGSSIMPQKRNPDAAELVRAKTGRDHRRAGRAADGDEGPAARLCQGHAGGQGAGVRRRRRLGAVARRDRRHGARHDAGCSARMRALAGSGFSTATDLADWLVRVLRLPFRAAHHVTGRLVARAEAQGRRSRRTCRSPRCRRWSRGITEDVFSRADGRCLGRLPHQLRRHRARERRGAGGALAGGARMSAALLAACAALLLLAACGKKGRRAAPGPQNEIIYPRSFPTR